MCRFDSIGRFLESDDDGTYPIPNFVHRQVQAVPSHRRMPHAMANNYTYFYNGVRSFPEDPNNKDATNSTLNDYNPMILPLYKNNGPDGITSDLDGKLLDELTGRYHSGFTNADTGKVKYLMITRSSNYYPYCFQNKKPRYHKKTVHMVNYFSLSLLDDKLQPIPGAEVLVDIEKYYFKDRKSDLFADFSIAAARTTPGNNKKDHLFLITNAMSIIPMAVRRVPPGHNNDDDWVTKIQRPRLPNDVISGTGLQVRLTHPGEQISNPDFSALATMYPSMVIAKGKNMHLFDDQTLNSYFEIWPYANHTVQRVDFFSDNFTSFDDYTLTPDSIKDIGIATTTTSDLEEPSFLTDPKAEFKLPYNRGTSCCAEMTLSDGRNVKVGIAHSVTVGGGQKHMYLHHFYAFLDEAPFLIVGVSGLFCLASMQTTDADSSLHWLSQNNDTFKLRHTRIGNNGDYDCPRVQFTSGITNMIGHEGSFIIISFGIDDCYSRSIIVHKTKIEILLLGG